MANYGDGNYGDGTYGGGGNEVTLPLTIGFSTVGSLEADAATPTMLVEVSWATDPLDAPVYTDVTQYVRSVGSRRGRSFEYDRVEGGVASVVASNRDSRFDPDYASGPWYPSVKPTRRIRATGALGGTVYPIFAGFTEGFPQQFPGSGYDAAVALNASDWFYPLQAMKFAPGSTTLAQAIDTEPDPDEEGVDLTDTIYVASSALPMPQAFPAVIQVGTGTAIERMQVTANPAAGEYTVERGHDNTTPIKHPAGAAVLAIEVRFAQELTGTRITNALTFLGVAAADTDIDAGNSTVAASDDVAGQSILEHLLLIAETENGRLFAAADGTITFRERHHQFTDELTPRATFGPGGGEIPYLAAGDNTLSHDDTKIFNRVRVTIADGTVVERSDQTSIDAHFERVLEKSWPLATVVEAEAAAEYLLSRLKDSHIRLPRVTVTPDSSTWPAVFGVELGQRYTFKMAPPVGSTSVNEEVLVERVEHSRVPGRWDVSIEFSEADVTTYARLDTTGQDALDSGIALAY